MPKGKELSVEMCEREMEDAYWVDDEKLDVAYTADPEEEETVGEYDYSMTGDPDLHKD